MWPGNLWSRPIWTVTAHLNGFLFRMEPAQIGHVQRCIRALESRRNGRETDDSEKISGCYNNTIASPLTFKADNILAALLAV